jgi:conjugal transfer/entry exclusion protein
MKLDDVPAILKDVEKALESEELSPQGEAAVGKLLNLVEQLLAQQRDLLAEVQRLKELLEEKKRSKTTAAKPDAKPTDHSSEEQRRQRQPPAAGHRAEHGRRRRSALVQGSRYSRRAALSG